MKNFDLFKLSHLKAPRFFLIIFAAISLLTVGCAGDKTQSDSLSKTMPDARPSASPTSRTLNSADAISAFEKANLEIVSPHPFEKSKDADRVTVEFAKEIEGTEFSIPSAGKNMRGRVFSYANALDAAEMTLRYEGVANLFENSSEYKNSLYWSLYYKNLMVQISRKVPREKAKLYFDALLTVK